MNTLKRLIVCQFSFLLLAALAGCQPEFRGAFVRQSFPEQRSLIFNYPLEQQVDLYLKAMSEIHPPDLSLADLLASHGADIVPILKSRLVTEDRDIRKMELVAVFRR